LRFLIGGKVLSFGHGDSSLPPYFCPFSCPNFLIHYMVRAKVPYKIAFIFSSTLRFFPLLFSDIGMIVQAQRLRGLAMEKMNIFLRVKVYAKVAVPLILGAMVQSQQLEIVLQSKAFSGDPDRTYLHESILSPLDYSVLIFFTVFLIAVFVAWGVWGFGAFNGPTDHFLF
jgi:energy-coupling factor transport system permease protein